MKKKILSLLLSLAILVTFMPTMAFAHVVQPEGPTEFTAAAKLVDGETGEETEYPFLRMALDASRDGDTVVLQRDCRAGVSYDGDYNPINFGVDISGNSREVTLDLNGYSINSASDDSNFVINVLDDCTLNIDGTTEGSTIYGLVNVGAYDYPGYLNVNGGTYNTTSFEPVFEVYNDGEDGPFKTCRLEINNATIEHNVDFTINEEVQSKALIDYIGKIMEAFDESYLYLPGVVSVRAVDAVASINGTTINQTLVKPDAELIEKYVQLARNIGGSLPETLSTILNSLNRISSKEIAGLFTKAFPSYAVEADYTAIVSLNNSKINSQDGGINANTGSEVYVDTPKIKSLRGTYNEKTAFDSEKPESEIIADKNYKAIDLGTYGYLQKILTVVLQLSKLSEEGTIISEDSYLYRIIDSLLELDPEMAYAQVDGGKFVVNGDEDDDAYLNLVESKLFREFLSDTISKYYANDLEEHRDDVFAFNEKFDGCRVRVNGGSFSKLPLKATFGDGDDHNVSIKLIGDQTIETLDKGNCSQVFEEDTSILGTIEKYMLMMGGDDSPKGNPVKAASVLADFDKIPEGLEIVVADGAKLNLKTNTEFNYYNFSHENVAYAISDDRSVRRMPTIADPKAIRDSDFYKATGTVLPLHIIGFFTGGKYDAIDLPLKHKTTLAAELENSGTNFVVENGANLEINGKEVTKAYAPAKDSAVSVNFVAQTDKSVAKYNVVATKGTTNILASKTGVVDGKGDLDRMVNLSVVEGAKFCVPKENQKFTLSKGSKLDIEGNFVIDGAMRVLDTAAVNGKAKVNGTLYIDDTACSPSFTYQISKNGKLVAKNKDAEKNVDKLPQVKEEAMAKVLEAVGHERTSALEAIYQNALEAIENADTDAEVAEILEATLKEVKDNKLPVIKLTTSRYGKKKIKLTWTKFDQARYYKVYAKKVGSKSYKKLTIVKGTKTKLIVSKVAGKKLKKGKKYSFYVIPLNMNYNRFIYLNGTQVLKSNTKTIKR